MTQNCFHCGEAIPTGFTATIDIKGKPEPFCCYGCMAVAEVIVSGGLENFYQHRTSLSRRPDEFSRSQVDEMALYDDPELQADFVEFDGACSEAYLSISGITCAACIWLIERELRKLDGVEAFSLNHSSHKAHLRWQQSKCKLSKILLVVRRLGFQGHPYHEDQARQQAQKERRQSLFRVAVAGIATMQNMMFSVPLYLGIYSGIDTGFIELFRWVSMLMCLPVVLFSAQPFFRAALRDLRTRHLTMDLPVSLAILVAFVASAYITIFSEPSLEADVYFDSVSMFTFFLLLGRFIEMQTRLRHMNSDTEMHQLLPATAIVRQGHSEQSIPAHKLQVGDLLVVKQGQLAPADGVIFEGESRFDESALTGEFVPLAKTKGSPVTGGTAYIENTVIMKATATPKQSRVAAIIRLLDRAQSEKPQTQRLADQYAHYFVAFVLLATMGTGLYWYFHEPASAFAVVLSVLVVTCPCALSLATPAALTSANTQLRKKGFLVTKGHTLDALNSTTDVIFDKTGTLTRGELCLHHIDVFEGFDQRHALKVAAALEAHSTHPIAKAFEAYYEFPATQVKTALGKGLSGNAGGHTYYLGTHDFVLPAEAGKNLTTPHPGLRIYLSDGKRLLAQFLLSDSIREEARACVQQLQREGKQVHILSGDHEFSVRHTGMQLGISHLAFAQSPEQKLSYVKALQAQGKQVAMIGDGINDLPVLSGARVSIAMGEAADITKMNADAILLHSHLESLSAAFKTARRARRIILQNMSWAITYNLLMLPLAAMGWVPPYFAALGMSLSSLMVVFNSLRLRG